MKHLMLICAIMLGLSLGRSLAQEPAPEAVKQEMKKIAYMAGRWSGEANVRQRDGSTIKVLQEENIQFKLDGTVLLIEGIGRSTEAGHAVVFNSLAIVSYNQYTKEFKLRSHILDGNQTDAYFKVMEENHFEWGFDIPNTKAKIRFDIVLNPQTKSWIEKGEYSPDGTTWYPTIDMKLTKLD
jgi:hypothetical protein